MKHLQLFYKKIPWKNPQNVFLEILSNQNDMFWLDSSRAEKESRFSYMGKASGVYSNSGNKNQDVFSYLQKQLQKNHIHAILPCNFIGGYVGYFDYELQNSMWFFVDKFFAFDHLKKELYVVCLSEDKQKAEQWFSASALVIARKFTLSQSKGGNLPRRFPRSARNDLVESLTFQLARTHKQYLKDIATCKEYLKNGESYQICLTNSITTSAAVNDVALYYNLRELNPAPFGAFLKHNDVSILSSSPERFLSIDTQRNIESKPIKGTIKRSKNKEEDKKLASFLLHSEKDRAENLMITDLVRNDLGKVCKIGSVYVPHLITLESYETVHQLVSTIKGKLRDNVSEVDCIKSCFPGGSMTGAPKKRTMEIIATLEKKPRGVYSGALGFISLNGAVDLNIVIRTIVKNKNTLSIGTGGAILMQSDPEKEYQEMLLKADVLLQAIVQTTGAKKYILKGG